MSTDPTFRLLGSKKNWDRGAQSSRLQSFETEIFVDDENGIGLMAVNREGIDQAEAREDTELVALDMD